MPLHPSKFQVHKKNDKKKLWSCCLYHQFLRGAFNWGFDGVYKKSSVIDTSLFTFHIPVLIFVDWPSSIQSIRWQEIESSVWQVKMGMWITKFRNNQP